jgi:hypothetical protein
MIMNTTTDLLTATRTNSRLNVVAHQQKLCTRACDGCDNSRLAKAVTKVKPACGGLFQVKSGNLPSRCQLIMTFTRYQLSWAGRKDGSGKVHHLRLHFSDLETKVYSM